VDRTIRTVGESARGSQGIVGRIELVQRIEENDDLACLRGLGEQAPELLDELVEIVRQALDEIQRCLQFLAEAPEGAAEVGRTGGNTDEMGNDQQGLGVGGWGLGKNLIELGEEGGLAGTGGAGEQEDVRAPFALGEGEQLIEEGLAAADDVPLDAFRDEGLHELLFFCELIELRWGFGAVFIGDARQEIGVDPFTEGLEAD